MIKFLQANKKIMLITVSIFVLLVIISTLFQPIFPIEKSVQSKIAHFLVGILFAWLFWYALEQHHREHLVNPFVFIVGCIWGSSGFFFVRWLLSAIGLRFGSSSGIYDTLLYMAFPDWDLLIQGAHRNLLFHSNIVAIILIFVGLLKKWVWLRDIGMGLAVGVASHLMWDIVSVANYPYFYIKHLSGYAGAIWSISNAIIGVFIAYYFTGRSLISIDTKAS